MSDGEALTERDISPPAPGEGRGRELGDSAVCGLPVGLSRSVSAATLAATVRDVLEMLERGIVAQTPGLLTVQINRARDALAALSVLEQQHADAEKERDEYRFWNERVRVCEHHTQDVAAPVGDCLICNAEAAEAALQAAHDALREIEKRGTHRVHYYRHDRPPREELTVDARIARDALAAASAAAEHTETEKS